jgi:hypothetical protein
MNEPEDQGVVSSVHDRINETLNQLTSAYLLIEKAQAGLLAIRAELPRIPDGKILTASEIEMLAREKENQESS